MCCRCRGAQTKVEGGGTDVSLVSSLDSVLGWNQLLVDVLVSWTIVGLLSRRRFSLLSGSLVGASWRPLSLHSS